jgi:hypothetical protein
MTTKSRLESGVYTEEGGSKRETDFTDESRMFQNRPSRTRPAAPARTWPSRARDSDSAKGVTQEDPRLRSPDRSIDRFLFDRPIDRSIEKKPIDRSIGKPGGRRWNLEDANRLRKMRHLSKRNILWNIDFLDPGGCFVAKIFLKIFFQKYNFCEKPRLGQKY